MDGRERFQHEVIDQLHTTAVTAARAGGEAALRALDSEQLRVRTKTTGLDVVTRADLLSEQAIVDVINDLRPGDGFRGEEGTQRQSTTGVTWVVDPIDSTANLVRGLPMWSVSVAACNPDGVGLAGAVHGPALGQMFSGARGIGAFADDRSVEPLPSKTPLDSAMGLVGWSSGERSARLSRVIEELIYSAGRLRSPGSPALGLAWAAAGRADFAYYEQRFHEWDVAAGLVLCQEAGLSVRLEHAVNGPHRLLATRPHLAEQLESVLFS